MLKDLINKDRDGFRNLCETHEVAELHAFGSSVRGAFKESSDVDLVVDLKTQDPLRFGELMLDLWDKLEVFFGRKVDLLTLRSVKNPVMRQKMNGPKSLFMTDPKRKYWSDILIALDAIDHHLHGIETFEHYAAAETVKDAVERRLITIGEAVSKLIQIDPSDVFDDAEKIRAFRNRLVHSYDSTDDTLVWAIIRNHLAPLRKLAEVRST